MSKSVKNNIIHQRLKRHIICHHIYNELLFAIIVLNLIKCAEGVTFGESVDTTEIRSTSILIGAQSLYAGIALMLRQNIKKWMTDSKDPYIWIIWIIMVILCLINIYMLIEESENVLTQVISIVAPWPILAPLLSLLLYPIKWGTKRNMYFSETINWAEYVNTGTSASKLLNAEWKWILTILMLIGNMSICIKIFQKIDNTYPLILTLASTILFYIFGVGVEIKDGMLKRIKDNRVGSKDMMILPMFSYSTSTSALCIKFIDNKIKVSRRQCVWEELPILAEDVEEKKFEIYNDVLDDTDINDEFERKWKEASDSIRNYGRYCIIKGDFGDLEEKILIIINDPNVFGKYSSKLYCMTKAMIYSSLLLNLNNNSNKSWYIPITQGMNTFEDLVYLVIGKIPNTQHVMDWNCGITRDETKKRFETMIRKCRDYIDACVLLALIINILSRRGDKRFKQLECFFNGHDYEITLAKNNHIKISESYSLNRFKLGNIDDAKDISACDQLIEVIRENPQFTNENNHERGSSYQVIRLDQAFYIWMRLTASDLFVYIAAALLIILAS